MPSSTKASSNATVTSVQRGRPRQQYKCGHCDRIFKRSEHRIRHERTHTQDKPYVCRYCKKSYGRKDLVNRHERTLHAELHEQRQQRLSEVNSREGPGEANPAPKTIDSRLDGSQHASRYSDPITQPTNADSATVSVPPSGQLLVDASEAEQPQSDLPTTDAYQNTLCVPAVTQLNSDPGPSTSMPHGSVSSLQTLELARHMTQGLCHASIESQENRGCNSRESSSDVQLAEMEGERPAHSEPVPSQTMDVSLDTESTALEKSNSGMPPMPSLVHNLGSNEGGSNHSKDNETLDPVWNNLSSGTFSDLQDPMNLFCPYSQEGSGQADTVFPPWYNSLSTHMYDSSDIAMTQAGTTYQTRPSIFDYVPNVNAEPTPSGLVQPPHHPTASLRNLQYDQISRPKLDPSGVPYLRNTKSSPFSLPILDDVAYAALLNDLAVRLSIPEADVDLPPAAVCRCYISSYATSFNHHLPILHLPTWTPLSSSSPLTLAVCSIGALYRLEYSRARRIYDLALRATKHAPYLSQNNNQSPSGRSQQNLEPSAELPLWYMQTRILLSFFSIMSGDAQLVSETLESNGFFTLAYSHALDAAAVRRPGLESMSWLEWVVHESWNRALGAILVLSTLTMVICDVNPGLTVTKDLLIQPIASEDIWSSSSPDEWRQLWARYSEERGQLGNRTLKDMLADIITGQSAPDEPYHVSSFSALVLMHAVVVHMWQRSQVSQALCESWGSSPVAKANDTLSAALLSSALKSLARCELFIHRAGDKQHQAESQFAGEPPSLAFNCDAVLSLAYTRLYRPISATVRLSLTDVDQKDLSTNVTSYVAEKLDRGPQFLEVIARSLDNLKLPAIIGHLFVRKTAAFKLGVEFAIAGWESALLVTKWTHHIEMDLLRNIPIDERELELFKDVQDILIKAEYELSESISVAAGVARTWSCLLQDVWIWGITPRMGSVLEQLAKAYEQSRKTDGSQPIVSVDFGQ